MEETKRRRFIIRAVLEGEVDVQDAPEPTQEDVFGSFESSKVIVSSAYYNVQYEYRLATNTSRACMTSEPIENKNYTITVTDSNKYSISLRGVTSLEQVPRSESVDGYCYKSASINLTWGASQSATNQQAPYVWVSLKKNDGTAFTDEELANGAEAVFTYTEG